jgi:hypothetical protein
MVTFETIKNHFDSLAAEGKNAPTTAKNYTNTIFRICNDLDGLEDIAKCCNEGVVEYINLAYDHPGTRTTAFLAFLRAINTYEPLKAGVKPNVLTNIMEGFELSKTQAKELSIQTQLTQKVERMDSIIAEIEAHFPPLSDEVLLVNMYDEVAMRRDFDEVFLVVGDPPETVSRWINLATGQLVIKDFNKTNKKYDALRHTLHPKMLNMVREVSATRSYLLTLKTDTLFKKMGLVVPGIGSQMLRKSKVSTATEGDKILDPEVRHELHSKMKHSPGTQLTYRRELIQNDL